MPYVTLPIIPVYQQITLMDILCGEVAIRDTPIVLNETNTKTRYVDVLQPRFLQQFNLQRMAFSLKRFNTKHRELFEADRASLYHSFFIPKRTGGVRRIDAPCPDLMTALRELKTIFEREFSPSTHRATLYHTSAFAYIPGRSVVDALKRHQGNKSNWFLKLDFSNFFGSTTREFTMAMLKRIFPFNMMFTDCERMTNLEKAIDLCFLSGGLPQGTPISPMLTNLVMLPVDYEISRALRALEAPTKENPSGNSFVYTRYADDILISAKRGFNFREVQDALRKTLAQFQAPYRFKEEKTRYGSRAGQNWNLGLMINKDNEITVGHKRKRRLRAAIDSYMTGKEPWDYHDVKVLAGQINYYNMVEPKYIEEIMSYYGQKYGESVMERIKRDLSA